MVIVIKKHFEVHIIPQKIRSARLSLQLNWIPLVRPYLLQIIMRLLSTNIISIRKQY